MAGVAPTKCLVGPENDRYLVDNVGDLVIESANAGVDSVAAGIDYTLPENVEDLTLVDAAIEGHGNGSANKITGSASDNILTGGGGSDTLYGGLGNDWLDVVG
jgi:Ca2+-binding RTX toxin-like protein